MEEYKFSKFEEKMKRNKVIVKDIMEVFKKHEVTHKDLNLLFRLTKDEFEELAVIKKD